MGTARDAVETARDAVETAKGGAKRAATSAWSTLYDVAKVAVGVSSVARSFGLDVLDWTGLRRRRSMFLTVASFGAGLALGTGLGVMIAPMSGRATRRAIRRGFQEMKREAVGDIQKVADGVQELELRVEEKVDHMADVVKSKVEAAADGVKEMVADKAPSTSPEAAGRREAVKSFQGQDSAKDRSPSRFS